MNLQLVEDWRTILKKAWSVKFNVAAALFGGAELAVALYQPEGVPRGAFAGIAFMVSICAAGARVMAQKEMITVAVPEVKNGDTK